MSHYVLENSQEVSRLEKMSALSAYQPSEELENFEIRTGMCVLDAGCGSGMVGSYIAKTFPNVHIEGCDYSKIRVDQARQIQNEIRGLPIRYFVSPLEKIEASDNTYDRIVCRYVFEFLEDPLLVLKELYRVLKPGGRLLVIQFDGFLHNFHHGNLKLQSMLDLLEQRPIVDNFRGRKVPAMFLASEFKDVAWQVKAYGWHGDELLGEQEQMFERLTFAIPFIEEVLGSRSKAEEFRDLYCDQMLQPGSVLFYNKFLVQGSKI